ncbi:thioredoxin [Atopobacter phocae]|uniref:thioredoxin n=1 Tax=Atopobacter phocae TaxID=136492 RepID=UPI0004713694|nr:thioredoxin [Atopobacter phocae]
MVLELTDQMFEETVSEGLTLVDFWAPWCGPCRMQAPVIESLAETFEGKMTVAKLDVDENKEQAVKYGIMSIPTLMLFKDGEVVEKMIGLQPEEKLEALIEEHLA